MDTQMINFMIPTNLLRTFDQTAKEEERTRSELIRDAMREYVSGRGIRRQLWKIRAASVKHSKLSYDEAMELAEEAKQWARSTSK